MNVIEKDLLTQKDNIHKEYLEVTKKLEYLSDIKSKLKLKLIKRERQLNDKSYKIRKKLLKFGHKFALHNPCPMQSNKFCTDCYGFTKRVSGTKIVECKEFDDGAMECILRKDISNI